MEATVPRLRDDAMLPATRWASLVIFTVAAAAVFLLSPQTVIDLWGWQLSPSLRA